MLTYGLISFVAPAALLGFLSLPILWWLLRVIPPAPRRVRFPAIRLIMHLINPEESSAKTPIWLTILRVVALSLLILTAAHPLLNAGTELAGPGPMVIVVDDDWIAAKNWGDRQTGMANLIDRAERDNRAIALITTAPEITQARRNAASLLGAETAREIALALKPKPWAGNRKAAQALINDLKTDGPAHVFWLSNGVDAETAADFTTALNKLGDVTIWGDPAGALPSVLLPPTSDRNGLTVKLRRAQAGGPSTRRILTRDEEGHVITRKTLTIVAGNLTGSTRLELPIELRNRLALLQIEGEDTAAATVLVDERWRRRPVGLYSGVHQQPDQPLLDELFYLGRALDPFTEVRSGPVNQLMQRELALIILADPGRLPATEQTALETWMNKGGITVRFAGPRLAAETDSLLPVRLHKGDRKLGGALSWTKPVGLSPFEEASPFRGIRVPNDVKVRRQVLAQPTVDLPRKTWARLADGTPLVTADKRGEGWLVLIHTTANPTWSNLSLSGLFVEMLQNLVQLSRGVVGDMGEQALSPIQSIDGFGRLVQPLPGARTLSSNEIADAKPGPTRPPGFYGNRSARRAYNLSPTVSNLEPLGVLPGGATAKPYAASREIDLRPWLLTTALLLVLIDIFASLALRGYMTLSRSSAAAGFLFMLVGAAPVTAQSNAGDRDVQAIAGKVHLAYIASGNTKIDRTSRAGLAGLSIIANSRTAAELGGPVAVDPSHDDLVFFPIVYWPISEDMPMPDTTFLTRLKQYMQRGGTLFIDTRNEGALSFDTGQLGEIAQRLDIPPLRALPSDHVLTKAYYLMREFPGRWTGGRVWVERDASRTKDGVSSIIVGSHDWAAAWAVDESRKPVFPVVPGGERQREMSYRFGINLLMYVLTGNYKADQVHLPTILERLGQ